MLDERGVEWNDGGMFHRTYFVADGLHHIVFEHGGELYLQTSIGPIATAQAVEATLGRGTCRLLDGKCDKCGAIIHGHANMYLVSVGEGMRTVKHRDVRFCPNCGREVER